MPEEDNVASKLEVLREFGFGSLELEAKDLLNPDNIIQLGYHPSRIGIISDVDGVVFEEFEKRKTAAKFGDTGINVISIEDLIASKIAAGRLQDLADAEKLEKLAKKASEK